MLIFRGVSTTVDPWWVFVTFQKTKACQRPPKSWGHMAPFPRVIGRIHLFLFRDFRGLQGLRVVFVCAAKNGARTPRFTQNRSPRNFRASSGKTRDPMKIFTVTPWLQKKKWYQHRPQIASFRITAPLEVRTPYSKSCWKKSVGYFGKAPFLKGWTFRGQYLDRPAAIY